MARITLEDNVLTIATKMSDGNLGAMRVVCDCLTKGAAIDPISMLGGFGPVFSLDTLGIYGSNIWSLFTDVCSGDLRVFIAILRAYQLGYISESVLHQAIRGRGIDVPALVALVERELPEFQRTS